MRITQDRARFRLAARDVALTIDASVGARVVELSLSGHDVLIPSSLHPKNYGSTFWTSPQSVWDWPPPAEIDSAPYNPKTYGDRVVFEGAPSHALGVAVTKAFRVTEAGVVVIEYTITNHGSAALSLAPWEVTRVAHQGVTFFPCTARVEPRGARRPPESTAKAGLLWVSHDGPAPEDQKLYANGSSGWLAHATDDFLFVKTFPELSPGAAAPGEAEVEIFVNQSPRYVELEQQGAYASLAPRAAISWTVQWHLTALPAGAAPRTFDPELVRAVDVIVASSRPR